MEATDPRTDRLDLIWGADKIASELGVSTRRAYYMLEADQLPARKVGGRWVASRRPLAAFFLDEGAAA